jgi:hypothetical protein
MPRDKKPGRDRVDLKADPELIDVVAKAAAWRGMNFSDYVRFAMQEQALRDGFRRPHPEEGFLPVPVAAQAKPAEEPPKRPRGRPRKTE